MIVSMLTMSLFLFNSISNVYAIDQLIESGGITLIPDDVITDNVIEVGENYAKSMVRQPQTRMDGEVWTIQSSKTVVSHGPIKAAFGDIIPIGESRTKTCAWSVSCSQLIQLSGSTVYAENHARTKVRNAETLTNYKSKFSKIDGTCLYYYNWQK